MQVSRFAKLFLFPGLLTVGIGSDALADPPSQIDGALAVEWIVANCTEQPNGLVVMMAGMVLNGGDQAVVKSRREAVHAEIANRNATREEVCKRLNDSLREHLAKQGLQ